MFSSLSGYHTHVRLHSERKSYAHVCTFDDYSTDATGRIPCDRRFRRLCDLEYHIQSSHTVDGLRSRLFSENSLAEWLSTEGLPFDRNFENIVSHSSCPKLAATFTGRYSRPDFHLFLMQQQCRTVVLVGNDEFAHRRYACDAERMVKIASAIASCPEFHDIPIVYIRFNPHYYKVGGRLYDPPLHVRYSALKSVLDAVQNRTFPLRHPTGLNVVFLFYDIESPGSKVPLHLVADNADGDTFASVIVSCVCPTELGQMTRYRRADPTGVSG